MDLHNTEAAVPLELDQLCEGATRELLKRRYSYRTLRNYQLVWDRLVEFAKTQNCGNRYTTELALRFIQSFAIREGEQLKKGERWRCRLVFGIKMLDCFAHTGTIDRFAAEVTKLRIPNGMLKPLRDYEQYAKERCLLRPSSLDRHLYCIGVFVDFLGACGRDSLSQIQGSDISAFIKSKSAWKPSTVSDVVSHLHRFFRFLFMRDILPRDFSNVLPKVRVTKQSSIPSVWEQGLVDILLGAIDRNSPKGKRDYAILLLAARLGLRVSDIKNLALDDLHWESATIEIAQVKTRVPLVLPMSEEIGSALIDYLQAARPTSTHRQVFLKQEPPFDPFAERNNLGSIIRFWRDKARIKFRSRHRKGFHSLRHTLATSLLHAEVPLHVISDVLGHTSSASTFIYAKVDVEMLRIAAIDPEEVSHV